MESCFFFPGLIGLTISLAPLLVGFMMNDIQAKVDDFCLEMNEKVGITTIEKMEILNFVVISEFT